MAKLLLKIAIYILNLLPNTKLLVNNGGTKTTSNQKLSLRLTTYAILLTTILTAQIYPVQVTPQLIPPYSLKLSEYETTTSEKLFVNLLLTDVSELSRQVRLKMYIEGEGLNIRTLDFVVGANPISLDGGINQRLSNLDLRPYFNLNNLLGINAVQYNNTLPEGRYDFCFEVYDLISGQPLSRKTCFSAYLLLNDPPILNTPGNSDLVTAKDPQNIIFNWTPRHLNATNVQYEYTLKELWDTEIDPQAAFLASPPLHQETTFATTLLYGPANSQLLEGKSYGWQVRALVTDGISETSVFRNDGKSEIYSFNYQGNCDTPTFVLSEATNSKTVNITWQFSDHIRYQVQYRKEGYGEDDWFSVNAYNQETTIQNLEAGVTYEFRVGGECTTNGGFAYSSISQFTTPTDEEDAYYNCGVLPEINIENQDPLQNIGTNEVFKAGDFPVTVKEVSGSNGVYSGWGFITIPYLGDTKIRVEFENASLNTDYQLTDGIVETSYDANWGGIASIDDAIDDILGDDGDIKTFDATNIVIDEVVVDENGNITIIDENGNEIPIETGKPVVINGANNQQFTVNEDGTVTQGTTAEGGVATNDNTNGIANNGDVTQISSTDVTVVFKSSGFYDTDALREDVTDNKFTKHYETIPQANGGSYKVLYKAVSNVPNAPKVPNATDANDFIEADVTFSNNKTKDDIIFKTKQGTAVNATWSGNKATINLEQVHDFGKDEILAIVKPADSTAKYDVAGKVDVWHLQQQEIKVTIVPVGNATVSDDIKAAINAIYNPVGVNFNITVAPKFNISQSDWDVENGNGKLDIGDSNTLANYTVEERAIFNKYTADNSSEGQMYYMFVLGDDIKTTDVAIKGFMPLKRQYGFAFSPTNKAQTVAHELGHGIFGLEHPFSEYDTPEKSTNLLMDYNGGTEFTNMDWQKIHAPGLQLYLFQGDEAGEYKDGYLISKIIQEIRCKYKNEDYIIDGSLNSFIDRITHDYISDLKESGDYDITLLNYDNGTPVSVNTKIVIGRNKALSTLSRPPISPKIRESKRVITKKNIKTYEYDLGGVVIWSDYDLKLGTDGDEFVNYLARDNTYINVTADNDVDSSSDDLDKAETLEEIIITAVSLNTYVKNTLLKDNDISNKDFKIIKSIASCDAKELEIDTRFKIIKLMSEKWIINEKKEDLVLDLLKTIPSEDYNTILEKFKLTPEVYVSFAAGVNDFKLTDGAEDNKKRLYDELFTIWKNSKFYQDAKYHAQTGGSYDSSLKNEEFYREVQIEIEGYILENFDSDCITNYSNSHIIDLLTCIQIAPTTKIQEISYVDRKGIIEKILTVGSGTYFDGKYEKPIIRLLKYLPEDFDYDSFITYLTNTSIQVADGQRGATETASIIRLLFDKINDSFFLFSGDYRQELMEAFIYLKAKSIGLEASVADIKKGIEDYDIDLVKDKLAHYRYDYRNILKRLFTTAKEAVLPATAYSDVYISLETTLHDNGGRAPAKLIIEQTLKNGLETIELSEKEHDPFELILFLNLSKQPLLSDFTQTNEKGEKSAAMVPAIIAHYASEEGDNQTKADLIQTAVDVGTLLIPGGQVRGIGKLFYYADKISSLTSIAGTFNREENRELAAIFNKISIGTGLVGVADLVGSTGYKLLLKNNSTKIKALKETKILENLVDQSNDIIKIINDHPEQLTNLLNDGSTKIDELANILENEKIALGLDKSVSNSQVQKIDEAIEGLRNFSKTTELVFDIKSTYRGVDLNEFITNTWGFDKLETIHQEKVFELWAKADTENGAEALFNYMKNNKINLDSDKLTPWPPYNGFLRKPKTLTGEEILRDYPNLTFDRFQGLYNGKPSLKLAGSFASPVPVEKGVYGFDIETPFTHGSRALLDNVTEGTVYMKFKLLKTEGLQFKVGESLPWGMRDGKLIKGNAQQIQSTNINLVELEEGLDYLIMQRSINKGGKWVDDIPDKISGDLSKKVDDLLNNAKFCK